MLAALGGTRRKRNAPGGAHLARPAARRCDGTEVGDWTQGIADRLQAAGWQIAFRGDQFVSAWHIQTGERSGWHRTLQDVLGELGLK
jgi:hypothetical protein